MKLQAIRKWSPVKKIQVEKLALDLGLMKGGTAYTRFIILGRSRTGSNFLRGLISDNPQVISVGEIFRNEDRIDWDSPHFSSNASVLAAYQSDPVTFINKYLFRKFPVDIKAVGFKLFYYHAQNPPFNSIWKYLEEQKSVHILHIKRRNLLQTHVSRLRAAQNDKWVNTNGENEQQVSVWVDPQACLKDFEQTQKWEKDAEQLFANHPLMEILYEDLSTDYTAILAMIQKFLGLDNVPGIPRTYKQSSLPLSQSITNYAELKEYFKNSAYSVFFED
jgi:LPS sulfotransferase NodH